MNEMFDTPHEALGGCALWGAAADSEAALQAVLAYLGPSLDAAEPWAVRLEEILGAFVADLAERRALKSRIVHEVTPSLALLAHTANSIASCASVDRGQHSD
jgi:hypothetical protein